MTGIATLLAPSKMPEQTPLWLGTVQTATVGSCTVLLDGSDTPVTARGTATVGDRIIVTRIRRTLYVLGGGYGGVSSPAYEQIRGKIETFTVTAEGPQTWYLAEVPLDQTLHVRWVPNYMPENNWSLSTNVLTVADPGWRIDDVVEVEYLYNNTSAATDPTPEPPPPPPPAPSGVLVDFEDPTWRHLQVARTDTVDYSSPSYDDSAWPVDPAAFGDNTDPAHYPSWPTYTTLWNRNSKMWVRRPLTPVAGTDVIITARWDRYLKVYWNGVDQFGSLNDTVSGTGPRTIPGSLVTGSDFLAISCTDDGWTGAGTGNCYFDVKVEQ